MIRRQHALDLESEDEDLENIDFEYIQFIDETDDNFGDIIDEVNGIIITPPTTLNQLNGTVEGVRRPGRRGGLRNPNPMNNGEEDNDDDDSDDMDNITMMNLLSTFRHTDVSQRTLLPATPTIAAGAINSSTTTHSGQMVLLVLKPISFIGRVSNNCILTQNFSCCIEVDGIKRKVPIYHNSHSDTDTNNTTTAIHPKSQMKVKFQTKECIWELFDYYGPLKIEIQIFQHFLFAKKLLGRFDVDLKTYNSIPITKSTMIQMPTKASSPIKTRMTTTERTNKNHNTSLQQPPSSSSLIFPSVTRNNNITAPISSSTTATPVANSTNNTNDGLTPIATSCPLKHTRLVTIPIDNYSSWMIGNHSLFCGALSLSKITNSRAGSYNNPNDTSADSIEYRDDEHINNSTYASNHATTATTSSARCGSNLLLKMEYNMIFLKNCYVLRKCDEFCTPLHQIHYHDNSNSINSNTHNYNRQIQMHQATTTSAHAVTTHIANGDTAHHTAADISSSSNNALISITTITNTATNAGTAATHVTYSSNTSTPPTQFTLSVPPVSNVSMSDFHLMAAYGSIHIINHILYLSARNQTLRSLLGLRDSNQRNALDVALLHGNVFVVKTLLSRAGHLCFQNILPNTSTPLHYAIRSGNLKCLKLVLFFLRKHVEQVQKHCQFPVPTPLARSVPTAIPNEYEIQGLQTSKMKFKAVLDTKDENGNTALSLACSLIQSTSSTSALVPKSTATESSSSLSALASHYLNPSSSNNHTTTAITATITKNSQKVNPHHRISDRMIHLLLMLGAQSACINHDKKTPLMFACEKGRLNIVMLLLSKHTRNINNNTAATVINNETNHNRQNNRRTNTATSSSTATSIHYTAEPWLKDSDGNTCMMLAVINQQIEIVRHLAINHRLGSVADTNTNGDNIFHLLARGNDSNSTDNNSSSNNSSGGFCYSSRNNNGNSNIINGNNNNETNKNNTSFEELLSHFKILEQHNWQAYRASTRIHSTFTTMRTGQRMLLVANHQGKRPMDVAIESGRMEIAVSLYTMAVEIYDLKRDGGGRGGGSAASDSNNSNGNNNSNNTIMMKAKNLKLLFDYVNTLDDNNDGDGDDNNDDDNNINKVVDDDIAENEVPNESNQQHHRSFINNIRSFVQRSFNIGNSNGSRNNNKNNNSSDTKKNRVNASSRKDSQNKKNRSNNTKRKIEILAMMKTTAPSSSTAVPSKTNEINIKTTTIKNNNNKINTDDDNANNNNNSNNSNNNNNDDDEDAIAIETYEERNYADKLAYDTALTYNDHGNLIYLNLTEPPEAYRQGLSTEKDSSSSSSSSTEQKDGDGKTTPTKSLSLLSNGSTLQSLLYSQSSVVDIGIVGSDSNKVSSGSGRGSSSDSSQNAAIAFAIKNVEQLNQKLHISNNIDVIVSPSSSSSSSSIAPPPPPPTLLPLTPPPPPPPSALVSPPPPPQLLLLQPQEINATLASIRAALQSQNHEYTSSNSYTIDHGDDGVEEKKD